MSNSKIKGETYGAQYWFVNQLTKNDLRALETIIAGGDLPVLAGFKWELRYLSAMELIKFEKEDQSFSITSKGREALEYFKNRLF